MSAAPASTITRTRDGLEGLDDAPMRVLMTVDAVGGVWRYAMTLGSGLAQRGVSVFFAGFGPRPSARQAAEADAIGQLHWCEAPLDWTTEDERTIRCIPDMIAALIEKTGADLAHLNAPSQAAELDEEVPVVAVSHSCLVSWFRAVRRTAVPKEFAWHSGRNEAGFRRADAVLVPTASHGDLLRTCYRAHPPLHVVHNAVNDVALHTERAPFVFAAARWWDEGKNAETLDAAARVSPWPVLMAGSLSGPNGQRCHLSHATHCGELSYRDIGQFMARAGIFVSPSIYEPFGLAALEAALAGTPLVLADIPGYRELWHGAALFADPFCPDSFAASIERLSRDPHLRHELGRQARSRAETFSLERQTEAVLQVYEAVTQKAAPAARAMES